MTRSRRTLVLGLLVAAIGLAAIPGVQGQEVQVGITSATSAGGAGQRASTHQLRVAGFAGGLAPLTAFAGDSRFAAQGSVLAIEGTVFNAAPPVKYAWTVDGGAAGIAAAGKIQTSVDTGKLAVGVHSLALKATDSRGFSAASVTKLQVFKVRSRQLVDSGGTLAPNLVVTSNTQPLLPLTTVVNFDVPAGAGRLDLVLNYVDPLGGANNAAAAFTIQDPAGTYANDGDGASNNAGPQTAHITNPEAGAWQVTLYTLNGYPVTYEFTATAQLQPASLVPALHVDPIRVFDQGAPQVLKASATGGTAPVTISWDTTGDGVFDSLGSIVTTHLGLGTHLVEVEASDGNGFVTRQTVPVKVVQPGTSATTPGLVVVAITDTGINPYHQDFSATTFPDPSILQLTGNFTKDPATYIPGYPQGTPAIPITLGRGYDPPQDQHLWAESGASSYIQMNKLYWIPGTKIIGAVETGLGNGTTGVTNTPSRILDTNGHGTASASVAVGNVYGSCGACLLVDIHGLGGEGYAYSQPWIDFASNSFGAAGDAGTPPPSGGPSFPAASAERGQIALYAAGNGNEDAFVTPEQTYISNDTGPEWALRIGAVDRDTRQPFLGTGKPVDASSFGLGNIPAADYLSTDGQVQHNGTSAATPISAGVFASTLAAIRSYIGDQGTGQRTAAQGAIAVGRPIPGSPFLKDGILTRTELIEAVLKSAQHYGGAPSVGFPETVPPNQFQYAVEGYGILELPVVPKALSVLMGQAPLPQRPDEDSFFANDYAIRAAIWGSWKGGGADSSGATASTPVRHLKVTRAQVSSFDRVLPLLLQDSGNGSASGPGGSIALLSPDPNATIDPGDGSVSVRGTAVFPASAYTSSPARFYEHRNGCGTGQDNTTYLSRKQWNGAANTYDAGNNCGLTFQDIAPTGAATFTYAYPLLSSALPISLGGDRPISGQIVEKVTGADPQRQITISVVSGSTVLGSVTETFSAVQGDVTTPFSFPVPVSVVGRPLTALQLVVQVDQSTAAQAGERTNDSYVDLPVTTGLPAGTGVQMGLDSGFAHAVTVAVARDGSFSGRLSTHGLKPGAHSVNVREVVAGRPGRSAGTAFNLLGPSGAGSIQVLLQSADGKWSSGWVVPLDLGGDGAYSSWVAWFDTSSLPDGSYVLHTRLLQEGFDVADAAPVTVTIKSGQAH